MFFAETNSTHDWDAPADWDQIRDRVLAYLDAGAMVSISMGTGPDRYGPQAPAKVPLGFLTDGTWIWALGVAYYVRRYNLPIDPDLLAHMRENGFIVPIPDSDTVSEALAQIDARSAQYVAAHRDIKLENIWQQNSQQVERNG